MSGFSHAAGALEIIVAGLVRSCRPLLRCILVFASCFPETPASLLAYQRCGGRSRDKADRSFTIGLNFLAPTSNDWTTPVNSDCLTRSASPEYALPFLSRRP